MALGTSVAGDISRATLDYYIRSKVFMQTLQERPLMRHLLAQKETFPGGKGNIDLRVQGVFMNSVSGFFSGYTEDEQLVFKQAQNLLSAQYAWYETHAGLIITETELKKDGVSVSDDMKTSDHSQAEVVRLTSLLKNRLSDFGESWARAFNDMLWRDGSQDSQVTPGVQALITTTPTTGSTGGLSRVTYTWWRNRAKLNIAVSESDQTMAKTLRSETRQLRRYGGRPNIVVAGSAFLEALEAELQAKGQYTQDGFRNEGKNDIGIADISLRGLGRFEYDPTMDDLGLSKYCYCLDGARGIKLMPMEGEDNKVRNPTRPYDYFVFLRSMTWTGALCTSQLNANEVFAIA